MDITNKPGPTSKRKHKIGFHLNYKIICYVAIFFIIFPKSSNAQSSNDLYCDQFPICNDERFESPKPFCVNHTCTCLEGFCVHFTTFNNKYYNYYCGECGVIGSTCLSDNDCLNPGECYNGFCICDFGYLVSDVCLRFEPITTSVASIVLIIVLIFLLILNKIIVSFESIKNVFWRLVRCSYCRREENLQEDTAYGYNEEGREKSPAYTISSREFITSSDDPDLEWALQLSAQLTRDEANRRRSLSESFRFTQRNRRYGRQRQQQSSSTNSSVRSNTSSLSSVSTPISSRSSTLYGRVRETPTGSRPSGRRRGFYSLFQEDENVRGEVILTRILNHRSRQPSESSEEYTETALQLITSTVDTEGSSGASLSPPESMKEMSISEEISEKQKQVSVSKDELQEFQKTETSDSDCDSTSVNTNL